MEKIERMPKGRIGDPQHEAERKRLEDTLAFIENLRGLINSVKAADATKPGEEVQVRDQGVTFPGHPCIPWEGIFKTMQECQGLLMGYGQMVKSHTLPRMTPDQELAVRDDEVSKVADFLWNLDVNGLQSPGDLADQIICREHRG